MSAEAEKLEVFKDCALFQPLPPAQREDLYNLFDWIVLNEGNEIIREGDRADFLLVVSSGALEVSRRRGDDSQLIGFARAGSVLGEMGILTEETRFATCRAISSTRVGLLSRDCFSGLRSSNPELFVQLISQLTGNLCRRLRQTTELVGNLKQRNEIALKAATQILEAAMSS